MVKKIGAAEFESEAKKGLSLVDFNATWCGPCKMLAPVLEELSSETPAMKFYAVDVDENVPLAMEYGISSIPALLVMKDGVKQELLVGFRPKASLKDALAKYLG